MTRGKRRKLATWLSVAVLALVVARSACAQSSGDERRCTGQSRATVNERITSCTALIDSGLYQPNNLAILHNNRGVALRAQGDLAAAVKDFTAAIGANPDFARAYSNRGSTLLTQLNFEGAIADLDQAIKLDPSDAAALMARGYAYYEKGNSARAIEDYNEAIRLAPNYAAAYFNRGLARRRTGELDLAIADYSQTIRFDFRDASAYNDRGVVFFQSGDPVRSDARERVQQSRQCLAQQRRPGPRGGGFRSRHQAIAALCASLRQPRADFLPEAGLRTRHCRFHRGGPGRSKQRAGLPPPRQCV